MNTEITEYKLHEYRQGRHAFAGRRLFKSSDAGAVMDFAKTLRGFSYAMIKTTTLVIRSETDDEDALTYTESSYTILHRPAQGVPFETSDWLPFELDNYALVEVHMEGTTGPEIETTLATFTKFKEDDMAMLTEYALERLQHDAMVAVFGSAHVKADREHILQLHKVEEKADDLLNEMAHRLQGGEYYGH